MIFTFLSKNWFSMKFYEILQKSLSGTPKLFLRPRASKKLPERCVYKGFCAGGSRVPFWAQKRAFGLQNPKMGRISCFGAKKGKPASQKGECAQKVKYFLGNTNGSDMSEIMIFLEISWFSWFFHFFMESAEKVFYFFQKNHVFAPARPAAANVV